MSFLNPDIDAGFDIAGAAAVFQTHGHVRLAGVLPPARAETLAQTVDTLGDWVLAYGASQGVGRVAPQDIPAWPEDTRKAFNQTLIDSARRGEGFAYFARPLDAAAGDLPAPLAELRSGVMEPAVLDLVARLTGVSGVTGVDTSATQFRPGHYLTRHTDSPRGQGRRLAFVWGLTRNWHPDWGGLLQFYQPDGTPNLAFTPGFNTLDLFSVDKVHAVTYVAPFAGAPRSAVSGWYLGG
ncbi:MAG: 2OG-Fe(II) oxygenase family protein [Pseudomonadota bacterium]